MYVPGRTHGPSGSHFVLNGVPEIGMEQLSTAHWRALAPPEHQARYLWVIVRHEIDYLRPLLPGQSCTGRTWVGAPKGARFDRHFEFIGDKPHVRAITW